MRMFSSRLSLVAAALAVTMTLIPRAVHADVYTHQDSLTFQWAPASGSVDFYVVQISVDSAPFQTAPGSPVLAETAPAEYVLQAEDQRSYRVRVRAGSNDSGLGPLSDASESVVVFLNGTPEDTDGDRIPDAWEEANGFNPYDPKDAAADGDADQLSNYDEYQQGTDPAEADTDHDGVSDGLEVLGGMNPLNPLDNLPRANAGPDRAGDLHELVELDGSRSWDPNGDALSYRWRQVVGATVSLAGADAVRCGFEAPLTGRYVFELVVSDGQASSTPDRVVAWISNLSAPPLAQAGNDFLSPLEGPVIMDGTKSESPVGSPLRFSWVQTRGVAVTLMDPASSMPRFEPPGLGTYAFQLTVSNEVGESLPDEVIVQVVEELVPGDVHPSKNPDGILTFWDIILSWLYCNLPLLQPTAEEIAAMDVAPMTILEDTGSPIGIRLEPDGQVTLEDVNLLEDILHHIYKVDAWEVRSE